MLVRCVSNLPQSLPDSYRDKKHGYADDARLPLTVGKAYVVFAVTSYIGGFWFYVADEDFTYYPVWRPAPLFELIDGRLSRTWRAGLQGSSRKEWVLAFDEWAADPLYYERLVNGDAEAIQIFERNRRVMEAEFGLNAGG